MTLKRTPLYEQHVAHGARMVDFGGFEMPVRYAGEKVEHLAVRESAGLFDVSHMGEVFVEGNGALDAVQRLFTNDAAAIVDGQAMYAGLLNERGGFVDDCVLYRSSTERFLVVVNASNREKDFAWIDGVVRREFAGRAIARDDSNAWAQLAVQGPKAVNVVAQLCGESVRDMGFYHFAEGDMAGATGIIARTGYTGEDGFELYMPAADAPRLWDALIEAGVQPCGLACRDTLRLEAGMALYGNDIDDEHTPLEAGLGWIVKLDKGTEFLGAAALRAQKAAGVGRRLRGLEMEERGIPRHGYPVLSPSGELIGEVTSGTQAPFLGRPIAMAYVASEHAEPGAEVAVDIRGKPVRARVAKLPFYKRSKK
jgi:aminomethyltransferase